MTEQPPANVTNINANRYESPDEVSEADIIREFLSSVRHPGVGRDPTEIAQRILVESGLVDQDDSTDAELEWRSKVHAIELQTAALSDKEWDELVDPSSEYYDQAVAEVASILQYTHRSRNLELERRALVRLLYLRIAAMRVGQVESEPWIELAHRLILDPSPHRQLRGL